MIQKRVLWIREEMEYAVDRTPDRQSLLRSGDYDLSIVHSINEAFWQLENSSSAFDAVVVDSWVVAGNNEKWNKIQKKDYGRKGTSINFIIKLVQSLVGKNETNVPSSPQTFLPKNVVVILGNTQEYIDAFKGIHPDIHALTFGQVGPITLRLHFDKLFGFS
jgi:hypothetical protein